MPKLGLCNRLPSDPSATYGLFCVLDGHNGDAAALHVKESLPQVSTSKAAGSQYGDLLAPVMMCVAATSLMFSSNA